MMRCLLVAGVSLLLSTSACTVDDAPVREQGVLNYLEGMTQGSEQRAELCARNYHDRFFLWYCAAEEPVLDSLDDVLEGVGVRQGWPPQDFYFAVNAHSSSLVSRLTSVLNPRAVIFTAPGTLDYTLVGYMRGEGFAEVEAYDPVAETIHFYLVTYQIGCEPTCSYAERFLASNEVGWFNVSVYSHDDLRNNVLDCLRCHIPEGGDNEVILRMQEIGSPWTHWFHPTLGSRVLLDTFLEAHTEESYAGIPISMMEESAPQALEVILDQNGFSDQPNPYRGALINGDDPAVDEPNAAWMELYMAAVRGEVIPPPHFAISPFDRERVRSFTARYKDVLDGGSDAMPDLVDVFKEQDASYLSFSAAPGLDAKGLIEHGCGACHNGLFPSVGRNRFDVHNFPDNLTDEMRAEVRERLRLSDVDEKKMPPILGVRYTESELRLIEAALP